MFFRHELFFKPWFRESECVYWSENRKFLDFLGVNLCEKSIILEAWTLPWLRKFSSCSIFASIHTLISLNQGQGSVGNTIDFPHKIRPNRVIFEKNFRVEKHEKITQISLFYTPCTYETTQYYWIFCCSNLLYLGHFTSLINKLFGQIWRFCRKGKK